jgi:CheY-like chemotaxis protein
MRNKLLVIDRAELHLSVLSKIAEQVGFTATGAHSVVEASQLLNERSFDCITLDLSLGEESGLEVLQLLSQIKCRAPHALHLLRGLPRTRCESLPRT